MVKIKTKIIMTKEEKQLLLKDLSTRLPYSVKIKCSNCPINLSVTGIFGEYVYHTPYYVGGNIEINITKIDKIKPYLRLISSMTEGEKSELKEYLGAEEVGCDGFGYVEGGTLEDYVSRTPYSLCNYVIDWLNAHYFDYRGLIQIGLAIEAPEGMYNTRTE